MDNQKFYRYDAYTSVGDSIRLHLQEYEVVKETPCGYWIQEAHSEEYANLFGQPMKYWVSKTSKKRRAYPNKDAALESFIHRKRCQIGILKEQLRIAKESLEAGIELLDVANPIKKKHGSTLTPYRISNL